MKTIAPHPLRSWGTVYAILLMGTLASCAHLPNMDVKYYLTETDVSFKVVRTVTCDKNNYILAADSVIPTVTHSADRTSTRSVSLSRLKGTFSDPDVKFEHYADGRLKNFNSSSTGQGEAILKATIAFASPILGFSGERKPFPIECEQIRKLGDSKPITLTYEGRVELQIDRDQTIAPHPVTKIVVDQYKLSPALGYVCAAIVSRESPISKTTYVKQDGDILLHFREPGRVRIKVTTGGENSCQNDTVWDDYLTVAQVGTEDYLPVPPPTSFGKRTIAASFAESGALSLLHYSSITGAAQALTAASAAMTAAEGETAAQRANAIKAEADLIAQQQRLLQCIADPETCK